jgi:hypothetical protein
MSLESELIARLNEVGRFYGCKPIVKYEADRTPIGIPDGFRAIFSLVYNYGNKDCAFDILLFDDEVLVNEKYYLFGKNLTHSLDYAINKISGEVLAIDDNGDVAFKCARDSMSFLEAMFELLRLELIYAQRLQVDESVKFNFQKECSEIAGGVAYQAYYQLII